MDEGCEVGEQLGVRIENPGFTRVDIQTVKQIIFQKVRDAERDILFKEFKHREGDLVTGIARRYERGNVIIDLGKADAILPRREIIYGETFKPGDRVQAYLTEVLMTNRGPEIRLSRTSPKFLVKLFEIEVPELTDGTIELKAAAREPGHRAKIAVHTEDRDIDPVGACVGMKGSRVQAIVNELQNEKIDIVRWSESVDFFAKAALAPADITSISRNESERVLDVIVEDDQLALAIGRRGQNVRLAAMLTSWKINIISKTKLQEKINASVENLAQLETVSDAIAQVLVQCGVMSVIDLSASEPEALASSAGLDAKSVGAMIEEASKAIENEAISNEAPEDEEIISAYANPTVRESYHKEGRIQAEESSGEDKFSEAEKRLREELAAFKIK